MNVAGSGTQTQYADADAADVGGQNTLYFHFCLSLFDFRWKLVKYREIINIFLWTSADCLLFAIQDHAADAMRWCQYPPLPGRLLLFQWAFSITRWADLQHVSLIDIQQPAAARRAEPKQYINTCIIYLTHLQAIPHSVQAIQSENEDEKSTARNSSTSTSATDCRTIWLKSHEY